MSHQKPKANYPLRHFIIIFRSLQEIRTSQSEFRQTGSDEFFVTVQVQVTKNISTYFIILIKIQHDQSMFLNYATARFNWKERRNVFRNLKKICFVQSVNNSTHIKQIWNKYNIKRTLLHEICHHCIETKTKNAYTGNDKLILLCVFIFLYCLQIWTCSVS